MLTNHAKERMAKNAITLEQVGEAINRGAIIKQTDGLLASYGCLKVAYKIKDKKYIIKTVFIK